MAAVDEMTKTFQVVLKKFGLPEKFRLPTYGCHISDRKLVTKFFVHCLKDPGRVQNVLGSD
jgi:hypothetical protein